MTHLIREVLIRGVIVAAGNFITPRIKKMLVLRRFKEVCLIRGVRNHPKIISPPTYINPLI